MAEISIIKKTSLIEYFGRIDAEFYRPESLSADEIVKNQQHESLGRIVKNGYRVVYENTKILKAGKVDPEFDVRFLQATNIDVNGLEIALEDVGYVSGKDWIRYPKGRVNRGELLIEVKGKAEKVTLIPKDFPEKTLVSGSLFKLSIQTDKITPEFLFAFFNCKYGRIFRDRTKVNTLISFVSKPELYRIKIPILPFSYQRHISELIQLSFKKKKESKEQYSQATQLLERELGLDEVDKNFKIFNTISLSSVTSSNRVDAQCYKPEYVLYEKFLRKKGNFDSIGSLMLRATKGHQQEPTEKGSIPYVSIKDIKGVEVIAEERCESTPVTSTRNDLLLAVTGATIGKIGINYRYDNLAFCGDLLNLEIRKEKISPEYLLMILKSPVGQTQITRWITGSTNGHFTPSDLKKVLIPRLNPETENQISVLMKQSLMNKDQSEHLLSQAKSDVETLIEQAATKA